VIELIKIPGYPPLSLKHLYRLTDDTGILQHAKYTIPDRNMGYTTDDNARAVIVSAKYYELTNDQNILELLIKYLSFIYHAQRKDGFFNNFMNYERRFIDEKVSEDCWGRCVWASGYVFGNFSEMNIDLIAKEIFDKAIINAPKIQSPRAKAYSIIGIYHFLTKSNNNEYKMLAIDLANSLYKQFEKTKDGYWRWFEEYLTYGNAILPMGMFYAYQLSNKIEFLNTAIESTEFLVETLIKNGYLDPIGNRGWYYKNGVKSEYDHQPIEAGYMTLLFLTAYNITSNKKYLDLAWTSFDWFFGKNRHNKPVYCEETGGCFDGLTPKGVNLNQGAESLLVYLLAYLSMYEQIEVKERIYNLLSTSKI